MALKAGKQEIDLFDSLGVDLDSEEYKEYYQRAMEEISKAEKDGRMDELSEEERAEYRKIANEYIYVNVP